jgi:hypothetical protein
MLTSIPEKYHRDDKLYSVTVNRAQLAERVTLRHSVAEPPASKKGDRFIFLYWGNLLPTIAYAVEDGAP